MPVWSAHFIAYLASTQIGRNNGGKPQASPTSPRVASPSTAAKVSMASLTRILIRAIWLWTMATPVAVWSSTISGRLGCHGCWTKGGQGQCFFFLWGGGDWLLETWCNLHLFSYFPNHHGTDSSMMTPFDFHAVTAPSKHCFLLAVGEAMWYVLPHQISGIEHGKPQVSGFRLAGLYWIPSHILNSGLSAWDASGFPKNNQGMEIFPHTHTHTCARADTRSRVDSDVKKNIYLLHAERRFNSSWNSQDGHHSHY